jgi:hypothetical protein
MNLFIRFIIGYFSYLLATQIKYMKLDNTASALAFHLLGFLFLLLGIWFDKA